MAQLTGDQIATILASDTFKNRIKAVALMKAQYFTELGTPNRADVNRRMQKRKQFARRLLTTNHLDNPEHLREIAAHWLAYYQTASPDLDGNQIPNYSAIFNQFDPQFDYFAGVLLGDDTQTEIDW